MPFRQIDNPKGAFGYPGGTLTTGSQPTLQGPIGGEVHLFRNASTAATIPAGAAVCWSTLSTLGGEVAVSTVIGNGLFCGIALTSAGVNTDRTASPGQVGSDYCQVQVTGIVYGALLSSVVTPGSFVINGNTTFTGIAGGVLTSGQVSSAAGVSCIVGIALSSGTTGTTGYLTTVGTRGVVVLRPSLIPNTTLGI